MNALGLTRTREPRRTVGADRVAAVDVVDVVATSDCWCSRDHRIVAGSTMLEARELDGRFIARFCSRDCRRGAR